MDLDEQATAEAKAWLRTLLAESGMSKTALADALGVEPKTMFNAFSDAASLPRGVTLYRLLRELGGLADQPAQSPQSVPDRLAQLEVQVQTAARATNQSLAALAAGMQRIEALLEAAAAQRRGRGTRG